MKKFAGNKRLVVIKAQCKAQGVAFDDYNFRVLGADYVCLGIAATDRRRPDGSPVVRQEGFHGNGYVMLNTFNGTFYGHTEHGVPFSSSSVEREAEPWFQALLSFFYVEEGLPAAPRRSTMVDYTLGGTRLLAGSAA